MHKQVFLKFTNCIGFNFHLIVPFDNRTHDMSGQNWCGRAIVYCTCSVHRIVNITIHIVPRAGIEPTTLAFQASMLTITPPRFPDVTTVPTPTCLCSLLPERSVQTTSTTIAINTNFTSDWGWLGWDSNFRPSRQEACPVPIHPLRPVILIVIHLFVVHRMCM